MSGLRVLLVEDDALQAKALGRILGSLGVSVSVADSALAGRAELARGPWDGVILDIGLPDGSGIDLLRTVRNAQPSLPVLVCSGILTSQVINEVYLHDAHFVAKPSHPCQFERFVERIRSRMSRDHATVTSAARRFAAHHSLTRTEVELLQLALRGCSRKQMAAERGTSENTIKSQVRALLRKTGARSVSELSSAVFGEALDDEGDPSRN